MNGPGTSESDVSDPHLDDLLGVFALDAVDDQERAAVERYLSISAAARHEVRSYHAVAEALATTPGEAPASVWHRIETGLVSASAPADVSPAVRRRGPTPVRRASGAPLPPSRDSARPSRLSAARSAAGVAVPLVGVAAALVAVLGLGTLTMRQRSQLNELRADATRSSEAAAADRQRIEQLSASLQQATEQSSDDARIVQLLSQRGSGVADLVHDGTQLAKIVVGPDGQGYLIGANLPKLPDGRTYQLWGVKDGVVLSLGIFGADPGTVRFAASDTWSQFVLTEEAAPGVTTSTQKAFAAGDVTVV